MSDTASNTVAKEVRPNDTSRPHDADDLALVDRSKRGDMDAFGSIVTRYQDRLYNLILRLCGSHADAEELTQETFLKALERLDQFRGESRFYTWLFRIAANMAISHRRRGARIRFQQLGGQDGMPEPGENEVRAPGRSGTRHQAPDASAIANENQAIILAALDGLDEQLKLVAVLREIEDLDYTEIARILDIPPGTVRSRLHRARCELKDKLGKLVN